MQIQLFSFFYLQGQNYNEHKYKYINEPKPWREAQRYCRQFHTDLVSVRNQDENLQIQQLIPAGQVTYIGLFQDAFAWSDNSASSFRNWDSAQPDGSGKCVAQHLQDHRLWDDQNCGSPRPFFCYASECVFPCLMCCGWSVRYRVQTSSCATAYSVKDHSKDSLPFKIHISFALVDFAQLVHQMRDHRGSHVLVR